MKIVKAIKLADDNMQEIWDCPVVYKVSKLELEADDEALSGNLGTTETPRTLVFVQGFKLPCATIGGYLAQDDKGYWRYLKQEEFEELNAK